MAPASAGAISLFTPVVTPAIAATNGAILMLLR
jgi:hypothetical protein